MNFDEDYELALKLQREFENEISPRNHIENVPISSPKRKRNPLQNQNRMPAGAIDANLNRTANLVDPEWEVVDPTPDIFALFGAFDVKFFQGKLKCVELEWSKKMYSCAGICYQRKNAVGKSCTIRLSEPLLKLRPRKNLVETLLHEMIHAYLFILNIREGNGHGPNFHKIMWNINKTAGTNITVYHTFHDEVNVYKTHVWRCTGICQERKPFFGYVRRTANRAPGPNDLWWRQHQISCGGTFQKIAAPEPKRRSSKNAGGATTNKVDGRQKINSPRWGFNRNSTVTITSKPKNVPSSMETVNLVKTPTPPRSIGNLTNVVGFRDLSADNTSTPKRVQPLGAGHILGQPNVRRTISSNVGSSESGDNVAANVRDRWNKRFSSAATPVDDQPKIKKSKNDWITIDDDIIMQDNQPTLICLDSGDEDENDHKDNIVQASPAIVQQSTEDRQKMIKKEILDDNINDNDEDGIESDIELIDDEYDDKLHNIATATLSDNHVINDIFGADTLMADFNEINDVVMKDCDNVGQSNREIIMCPICQERMHREELDEHLDGCLGISAKIHAKPSKNRAKQKQSVAATTSTALRSDRQILLDSGYDESLISKLLKDKAEEKAYNDRILNEMGASSSMANSVPIERPAANVELLPCPVCQGFIESSKMNDHLDVCLTNN